MVVWTLYVMLDYLTVNKSIALLDEKKNTEVYKNEDVKKENEKRRKRKKKERKRKEKEGLGCY